MTDNWLQILKRITELQHEIKIKGSIPWFRGHRSSDWKLQSTIHRHVERIITGTSAKFSDQEKKSYLRDEYKTLYRYFSNDVWMLLNASERTEWGIVFSMQHYGLPTRFLDWTESFICALYFAQHQRLPNGEAAIYVLDPQKLNRQSVGREGLIHVGFDSSPAVIDTQNWHPHYAIPEEDLTTIAVAPLFSNPRMVAQRSGFTISGDSFDPLEEQEAARGAIEKIILPIDTFDDAEAFLELAGVNAFNYFPDHEGLKMKHEAKTQKLITDVQRFYSRTSND